MKNATYLPLSDKELFQYYFEQGLSDLNQFWIETHKPNWKECRARLLSFWKEKVKLPEKNIELLGKSYDDLKKLNVNILYVDKNLKIQNEYRQKYNQIRQLRNGPFDLKTLMANLNRKAGNSISLPFKNKIKKSLEKDLKQRIKLAKILFKQCVKYGIDPTSVFHDVCDKITQAISQKHQQEYDEALRTIQWQQKIKLPSRIKSHNEIVIQSQAQLVDYLSSFFSKKQQGAMQTVAELCYLTGIEQSKNIHTIKSHYFLAKKFPNYVSPASS